MVLAANALPAINDITADELRTLVGQAAAVDLVIQVTTGSFRSFQMVTCRDLHAHPTLHTICLTASRECLLQAAWQAGSGSSDAAASPPPLPGLQRRVPSSGRLAELGASAAAAASSLHMAMSSSPPSGSPSRGSLGNSSAQQRRRSREAAGSGSGSPQHGVVWSPDSLPDATGSPQRSAAASKLRNSGDNGSANADSSRAATAKLPVVDAKSPTQPGGSDSSSTSVPRSRQSGSR